MPSAADVIERLAGELEIYKLFAMAKGCPTKEDVMREVAALIQRDDPDVNS